MNIPKTVHIIGIGGIGVSAMALYLHSQGASVTGSDLVESELIVFLRSQGIDIWTPHDRKRIPEQVELCVISPAVRDDNEEVAELASRGVPIKTYPQMLGEISQTRETIAITGMHGKSTTTAMMATVFEGAGVDPLVIVGTKVPGFPLGNLRISQTPHAPFIVEACEYRGHMNEISPRDIVITNIDREHLDFFKDIDHIRATFQQFVVKLPEGGVLVYNSEDAEVKSLVVPSGARSVTFGLDVGADYKLIPGSFENGHRTVVVEARGVTLGTVELSVPGMHNVLNAGAVIALATERGLAFEDIAQSLKGFTGIWRRFEKVGMFKQAPVYSDYGHHPTEILATLSAMREMYPDKQVILAFEPHQHDRTEKLFNEFISALNSADHVLLADIFDVAGREEESSVTSKQLAAACHTIVQYVGTLAQLETILREKDLENRVILIMGAGTIDRVARNLTV